MLKELALVFIGGGAGSMLRYGVQIIFRTPLSSPGTFPWSTFIVNLAGSFLIGLFYALSARFHLSDDVRLLLTTGLCGGFTTFSTFSNEGVTLLRQGHIGIFTLYVSLSIALGISLVFLGSWSGREWFTHGNGM